jgi:hypothetical protein
VNNSGLDTTAVTRSEKQALETINADIRKSKLTMEIGIEDLSTNFDKNMLAL